MKQKLKMIYIVGLGHSGSTILDLMLGSHSCIESAGEFRCFPRYASEKEWHLRPNRTCTCHLPFDKCPYWTKVKNELIESCGTYLLDIEAKDKKTFDKNNYEIISAIFRMTGKQVFCDSPKTVDRLQRLLRSDLFDISVVHIIRDPRAVAYSWILDNDKKNIKNSKFYFYKFLLGWQKSTLRIQKEFANYPNYICLKYEDLVLNPIHSIKRILKLSKLSLEKEQCNFWKSTHHNLSGNLTRMKGEQEIIWDKKYINGLTFIQWYVGNAFILESLKRHHYPIAKQDLLSKMNKNFERDEKQSS